MALVPDGNASVASQVFAAWATNLNLSSADVGCPSSGGAGGAKATSKAGPFSEAGTEADDEAARYGAVVQAGSEATGDGNHLAMALESLVTKASYH